MEIKDDIRITLVNLVTTEEKRLLLNDPDLLVNRLNHVENVVAILNATVRQLTTENNQQAVTNQQQEKTIQEQQSSIQQQQMSIQQQNTSIQQHQTLIQQHQVLIKQHEQTIKQLQGSIISIQSKSHLNYVKTNGPCCAHMYAGEFDTNLFASDSDNEDVPCAMLFCLIDYTKALY
ncbi:unnamed protein product [Mytilus edulis]|uniref:Uncharacterized protein n=1 Tax=Mytilus edulis TaxID=6550 RepID=A0A8S3QPC7_MYTED|nr:unnamed protein product [Mytilus edulis]